MSDIQGIKIKERVSKIRHKPERESVLRRTFAASQDHSTNPVQTAAIQTSIGPSGEPALSAEKMQASESRFAHDFSQVPTHTTQGIGGLRPGVSTEDIPRLRIGGAGDGVAIDGGNVVRRDVDEPAGITISTNNTFPATWYPHGAFRWHVGFQTTGTNGWIVQRVTNTYEGEDSIGGPISNTTVGMTPRYWEAWAVDAGGAVSPSDGATNDMFERPELSTDAAFMDPNTQGRFSMAGEVYWTTTDPATSGMAEEGVPDAGMLLASTSEPDELGASRLSRFAEGTWDSTVDPPTHVGNTR